MNKGEPPRQVSLGLKDEAAARAKLREIVTEAQREAYGLLPKKSYREAAGCPLGALLEEYRVDLNAQQRAPGHVKESVARIRKIIAACNWRRLRDITPARFLLWRGAFDRAAKTRKEYQVSLNAWLNWLVATERLERNPLARVPLPDIRGKQVRPARALTQDELRALFEASGENALAYQMLAYTGQRCCEIAALVWGDVHLGSEPYLHVRQSTTKDKAERAIPLHPGLAAALRAARPVNAPVDGPIFADFPTVERFYTDLKRAGIARKDALGRVVHRHALRKTFQTMGVQAGVNQRAAQEFLGHSDANLTAKIYTDLPAIGLRAEIEKLPWAGAWDGKEVPSAEVTKSRKNLPLIEKLIALLDLLKNLEGKGLKQDFSVFKLAARHGFEP
ncbi:MAG: tyrosine-type recombinase/integrase [Opitutaceae bacterium]|nr:tyrosine-type recombinase/integrase [Opitutaceae bacterium]